MARPDSIRSIGLQSYLDGTADRHNGWNYNDFRRMLLTSSRASMARNFGVTPNIIMKWASIYYQEGGTE